jgi:hypothetical protein
MDEAPGGLESVGAAALIGRLGWDVLLCDLAIDWLVRTRPKALGFDCVAPMALRRGRRTATRGRETSPSPRALPFCIQPD